MLSCNVVACNNVPRQGARDEVMCDRLTEKMFVSRSGDHLSAKAGGQTVLMSIKQGKYAGLDSIGSAIWDRLEKPISIEMLCADLLDAYQAEPGMLRQDVLKFLNELYALGMIGVTA